ncbi:MAG: hypothetical protein HQM10_16240 [Candidatus Riflebacteria bacterium]|nr:hypothetical protein [Candidatus Riflebacteria bacterium]
MKKIIFAVKYVFLASVFLFQFYFPSASIAQADKWEGYEVNAQYRGGVKKGFQDIGCAVSFFKNLTPDSKQSFFHACVKHPEKRGVFYKIRLGLAYSFDKNGDSKILQEYYSSFEGFEADQYPQIRDMILLMGVVKDGLLSGTNKKDVQVGTSKILIQSDTMSSKTKRELVFISPGKKQLEGKFFLAADGAGKWNVEKFRLKRDKIVISFVGNPIAEIHTKYQKVDPFSTAVFALEASEKK